jgi:hypothetical protein
MKRSRGLQEELKRHEENLKSKNAESNQLRNQLIEARKLISQYQVRVRDP